MLREERFVAADEVLAHAESLRAFLSHLQDHTADPIAAQRLAEHQDALSAFFRQLQQAVAELHELPGAPDRERTTWETLFAELKAKLNVRERESLAADCREHNEAFQQSLKAAMQQTSDESLNTVYRDGLALSDAIDKDLA